MELAITCSRSGVRMRACRHFVVFLILITADRSKTHLLTLYFLDSGAYDEGIFSWLSFLTTDYDWIHKVLHPQRRNPCD